MKRSLTTHTSVVVDGWDVFMATFGWTFLENLVYLFLGNWIAGFRGKVDGN